MASRRGESFNWSNIKEFLNKLPDAGIYIANKCYYNENAALELTSLVNEKFLGILNSIDRNDLLRHVAVATTLYEKGVEEEDKKIIEKIEKSKNPVWRYFQEVVDECLTSKEFKKKVDKLYAKFEQLKQLKESIERKYQY